MISEVGYRGMTKAGVGLATVLAVVLSLLAISSTAEARSRQLLTGFGDEAYHGADTQTLGGAGGENARGSLGSSLSISYSGQT